MDVNLIAQEKIEELEADLEEAYVVIDLRDEDIADLKCQLRLAKKQIQSLMNGQRVDYG